MGKGKEVAAQGAQKAGQKIETLEFMGSMIEKKPDKTSEKNKGMEVSQSYFDPY